ncbi:hypothetical protein VHUM_02604 [Vanrija humicola]|uniref:HRDC domain-containing protein n=1 Tax=Vanrija humicola TaxID=5417 RepID=A0A7D8UZK1_VANHU|nr:hypothetical protein VHUM_02604 [Vanrija humicola]
MTAALDASTSAAANFPDKKELSFQRTLDRKLGRELDKTSGRVLSLVDRLHQLAAESSQEKAKAQGKNKIKPRRKITDEDDVVDSYGSVIEVVDGLLEDADSNLDEVNGQKKKAAIDLNPAAVAAAGNKLAGPFKPKLASDLAHDGSIAKPQRLFRDPVDNFATTWRPTLESKPHSMVPLGYTVGADEDLPYDDDPSDNRPSAVNRRERARQARNHPYYYETRHCPYPTAMFTSTPPIRPRSFEETPFEFVDTPEQLAALTEKLKAAKEIAVDLEYHSMRSYYGFICLMQISTREDDWVIDTLALRSELRDHKLGGVFVDPSIVKVFHGADSDIVWLQQDFDMYVVNLFDTYHASKVLDFPQFSLASLLQLYAHFEADKKYQMADWRIRPIPEEMMFYARSDTHFLLFIYDSLRNALIARSSRTPSPSADAEDDGGASTPKPNPQRAIREVLQRSAETALKLHSVDEYDGVKGTGKNGWASLAKKLGKKEVLDTEIGWVFKAVHKWRDTLSRQIDESPHYVLPNHIIIQLANLRSPKESVIARILTSKSTPLVADRTAEVAAVIQEAINGYREAAKRGPVGATPSPSSSSKPSPAPRTTASKSAGPQSKKAKTSAPAPTTTALPVTADLWAATIMGTTASPARTSSLFGNSLASKPQSQVKPASSSLFGTALSKGRGAKGAGAGRHASPGFEAVQRGIHGSLAPAPQPQVAEPTIAKPSATGTEPETVAFVPAAERTTTSTAAVATASSSNDKASKPAVVAAAPAASAKESNLVDEDGIIKQVKKKGKKPKKGKTGKGSVASDSAGATPEPAVPEESQAASSSTTAKAPKKAKVSHKDIPTFDYANETNLLDQPKSSAAPQTAKKAKGDKKGKKGGSGEPVVHVCALELANDRPGGTDKGPSFGRQPADPSAPKSGNKSGTFA